MENHNKEKAKRILSDIMTTPSECIIIHYARQNLYDNELGRATPRIVAIMLKSLDGKWNSCFAIHYEAEKAKIVLEEIENYFDLLESKLLVSFNAFVKKHKTKKWLHWDMNDVHYSFDALEHRFRVLTDDKIEFEEVPHDKRVNLNSILKDIYGADYEKSPQLEGLMKTNRKGLLPDYLSEQEEAKEFGDLKFPRILESLKAKTNFLIDVATMAFHDTLRVAKKFWVNKLKAFITHPVTATISILLTLTSIILKIVGLWE